MALVARTMCRQLSVSRLMSLQRNLKAAHRLEMPLRVGTGCAGTDLIQHSLNCLRAVWANDYNCDAVVQHCFSVEKDPARVRFLREHWEPERLYIDMEGLIADRGFDVISNSEVAFPDIDIWICGFECDSISPLNRNASLNRSCGSTQSEKTGSFGVSGGRHVCRRQS